MRRAVRRYGSRQSEKRRPDSLRDQRRSRDIELIRGGNFFEEQAILRHRKIDPGSGENQSIVATKRRNHDRRCHAQRARISECGLHRRNRDAILRRMLDFWKRQERQIRNVREHIQNHNGAGANQKRTDKISRRITHFAAKKRDVRPGGLGKDRTEPVHSNC